MTTFLLEHAAGLATGLLAVVMMLLLLSAPRSAASHPTGCLVRAHHVVVQRSLVPDTSHPWKPLSSQRPALTHPRDVS